MITLRIRRASLWVVPVLGLALAGCDDVSGDSTAAQTAEGDRRSVPIEGGYLSSRHAEEHYDWDTAADYTLQLLERQPDHPDLLRRAVLFLTTAGRVEEAVPLAEKLVAQSPDETVARLVLSVEAMRGGAHAEAAEVLSGIPESGSTDVLVPLVRAWTLMAQDKVDEALAAIDEMGKTRGLEVFVSLHRALILDLADRTEGAEAAYRAVLGDGAQAPMRAGLAFASFLQRHGRDADAREILALYEGDAADSVLLDWAIARVEAGETLPPLVENATEGLSEGLFDMASALSDQRVLRTATLYARLALHLQPDLAGAHYLIGSMSEQYQRWEDAIAAYRDVPEGHPLSWSAQLNVAGALDSLGRTDEAVSLLEAMIEERPKRWDAATELGDILRRHERFAEAADAYETAISRIGKIEERHWGLLYVRGITYERSDQWEKAEADFLRALELKPDDPYVLNYLAYSWVEQQEHLDRALRMLERAVAAEPDDGYIVDSMGWVLYRLGKFEKAVPHLERAVELRPHDPTINDHLGDAYWQVGRRTEARFQWKRALSFDPDEELEDKIRDKLAGRAAPDQASVAQ